MQQVENTIEAALVEMHLRDLDHASIENGVGFNGRDTEFGNSLANQILAGRTLSFRQRSAAYRMLRTYRTQLARYGIDYERIPKPEEPKPEPLSGQVYREDGRVVIQTDFDRTLLDLIKAVPGRKWEPDNKVWTAPLSAEAGPALQAVVDFAEGIQIEPELVAEIERLAVRQEANKEASAALDASLDLDLGAGLELLPFQRAGVRYALDNLDRGGVYIADEMGLGKTVQALAVLEAENAYPALVAVPKVVWLNWQREAHKWLPRRRVALLGPKNVSREVLTLAGADLVCIDEPLPEADVYVINYDLLTRREDLNGVEWQAVILDEAHMVKERKAKRTKAIQTLAKKARVRLALSGTPVPNRPAELITQLNILGRMQDLGGFPFFWGHFCQYDQRGAANLEELNERLRAHCYVRRTKDAVMPELPPIRWEELPTELADRDHYVKVQRDLFAWFREQVEADADFLASLEGLDEEDAEAAKHQRVAEKAQRSIRAEALSRINALRQVAAAEKIPATVEWVRQWLVSTDEKLILFTWHRDTGFKLSEALGAPLIIGGMDPGLKASHEQAFQNDPAVRVLVCAIQVAGVGLTLTAASNVAFVELPWRPMDLDQAVARCYGRINDIHGANAYSLIAEGTIDEWMYELIEKKRDVTGRAQDGSVFSEILKKLRGGEMD